MLCPRGAHLAYTNPLGNLPAACVCYGHSLSIAAIEPHTTSSIKPKRMVIRRSNSRKLASNACTNVLTEADNSCAIASGYSGSRLPTKPESPLKSRCGARRLSPIPSWVVPTTVRLLSWLVSTRDCCRPNTTTRRVDYDETRYFYVSSIQ